MVPLVAGMRHDDTRHANAACLNQPVLRASTRILLPIVLFGLALPIFLGDLRYVGSADTRPAELLPIAVLRDHALTFDGLGRDVADLSYDFVRVHDHVVSAYPIVPGLLNLPVYAVAARQGADIDAARGRLSAITAAIVCGVSVALMFWLLHNLTGSIPIATGGAIVYAFGTCVWSVASKAIWQHGPSLLFLVGGLALLTSRWAEKLAFPAGVLLGLAVWNRPTNLILVLGIAAWFAWWSGWHQRRSILALCLGAAIPVALMLVYSAVYLGRIDTLGQLQTYDGFRGNPLIGLPGLLLSPSRGLLVFSPVFLLSLVGVIVALRHPRQHSLALALAAAALLELLVFSRWYSWWGGHSFGYRLVIEVVPSMIVLAVIAWQEWARLRAYRIVAVAILVLLSLSVQWLGATYYPCGFNTTPNSIDEQPSRLWSITDGELARCVAKAESSPRS